MRRLWLSICISALACGDDTPAAEQGGSTGAAETGDATTGAIDSTSDGGLDESSGDDTTGTTGGEPLTRIEQVLQDVSIGMYECPDRVWPGPVLDNYRSRQLLFASESEDTAWLWNDQVADTGDPPRVTMGPLSSLPPEWTATFNVSSINGIPTVGISMDNTLAPEDEDVYVDFASVLAFHEGFHFLSGQDTWAVGVGSRSLPYPEPWEPRYVRAELIAALRAMLEDGDGPERARYWQDQWLADFPDEVADASPYDVTEGSAEYAAIISTALAKLGCDAEDTAIIDEAVAHLDDGFVGTGFTGGREFYDTGVLAGLLLRQDGIDGWEATTETGDTPTEQLLAGASADPQEENGDLRAEVEAAVEARNTMVGMEIDPMLADLQSSDAYRMVIDFAWLQGSFSLGGFYYLADDPMQPEVWLTLGGLFVTSGGETIELTGETSLMFVDTPCSATTSIVLTLPVEDVDVAGGTATSTAATAAFDNLEVEVATDGDGLEWLCPVASGGAEAPPPTPPLESPTAALHVVPLPDGRFLARP